MDAAVTLANHVVGVQYKDIPRQAVEATKKDILDTLGAALAGTSADGTKELIGLIKYWGGRKESSILVYGNKVPSLNAALVNGTMARALELDSCYHIPPVHSGVSILPAALAIAEQKGGVSGKDLITEVTLGLDVMVRMALGAKQFWGWSSAALYAYFGAAAAAGKLLALNEGKMLNTFGIAHSQATAEHQSIIDGALTKRLSSGLAAKGGVFAALLAKRGFTGAKNCLEGKWRLYNTFERGEYDPNMINSELGKRFAVVSINFKPYPCCGGNHGAIDATLSLIRDHNITPEQVDRVSVKLVSNLYQILCEPLEIKQKPQSIVAAQFSLPYNVATAIIERKVVLDNFTEEAIKRRDVLELAAKVIPEIDTKIKPLTPTSFRATVEIKTKNGKSFSKVQDIPKGGPKYPMTTEELTNKFRDCAAHAAKPLPQPNIDKVVELVNRLEDVTDVSSIIKLLIP